MKTGRCVGRERGGQRVDDVGLDEVEARVALQMAKVAASAGVKVVEADHVRAVGEQGVAKMRPEEPGASGDEDGLLLPFFMARSFPVLALRQAQTL